MGCVREREREGKEKEKKLVVQQDVQLLYLYLFYLSKHVALCKKRKKGTKSKKSQFSISTPYRLVPTPGRDARYFGVLHRHCLWYDDSHGDAFSWPSFSRRHQCQVEKISCSGPTNFYVYGSAFLVVLGNLFGREGNEVRGCLLLCKFGLRRDQGQIGCRLDRDWRRGSA